MSDFFSTMIRMQEETLKLQRLQLDAARKWSEAAGNGVAAQKSVAEAATAGMKARDAALGFWGIRR